MSTPKGKGKYSIVKGREAENEVVAYLKAEGFPLAERRRLSNHDTGDISGIPGVLLDIKNRKKIDLAAGMDDLALKVKLAQHNGESIYLNAMIFKRPRKGVEEWYAVMPFSDLVLLMDDEGAV